VGRIGGGLEQSGVGLEGSWVGRKDWLGLGEVGRRKENADVDFFRCECEGLLFLFLFLLFVYFLLLLLIFRDKVFDFFYGVLESGC
jgi:hypothetical protein